MSDFRDLVRSRAEESVEGEGYHQLRRRRAEREPGARFHEIVIPIAGDWPSIRDRIYPPFVRWLRAMKLDPEAPQGVVVAAFLGERCHLLDGRRFLDLLCEMESLNPSALHFRVVRWLGGRAG